MQDDPDAISTEGMGLCECCGQRRLVRMYVLANLEAAFVCKACRSGEKDK